MQPTQDRYSDDRYVDAMPDDARPDAHRDAPRDDTAASDALWNAAGLLYRWRRFIIGVTAVAAVAAVVFSLMLPNWYAASARLLAPENGGGGAGALASSLLKNLPSAATAFIGGTSGDYARYLTLLTSRSIQEQVVDRFDLVTVYDLADSDTPREDALEILADNTDFPINEEYEYLSVVVLDTDPERAAAMANYFVELLNTRNAELSAQSAGAYRRYVEQRHDEALRDWNDVLAARQAFQEEHGIYDVTAQTSAFFTQVAALSAEAAKAEIALGAARQQLGENNASVAQLEALTQSAERRYRQALSGGEAVMSVSQDEMPRVMREYLDLEREFRTQQAILEVVRPMLEQARFSEEEQTEAVQVIDPAVVPVVKAAPKRSVICIAATLSAFLLAVAFVLLYEGWRRHHAYVARRLRAAAERA